MSAYKPFNQAVHDACDPPARDAVIRYHATLGKIAKPYDKYKVDLIIENEFMVEVGYCEIEMRDWEYCPFPTIHVPSRKKKLVDNDLPTTYFVVSKSLKRAWWCNTKDILDAPLVEVPNKAVKKGEYFYDVPIEKFKEVELA
jgi:hypothetical protein